MSVLGSALASLASNYSDSEDEGIASNETNAYRSFNAVSSNNSASSASVKSYNSQTAGLVSYNLDVTILSEGGDAETLEHASKDARAAFQGDIPPKPSGTCPAEIQQKFTDLYGRIMNEDFDVYEMIQQTKSFKNPSMYEKAVGACGINEFGSIFERDEEKWKNYLYYDDLAKLQNKAMDKLTSGGGQAVKVEAVHGIAKPNAKENVNAGSEGRRARVEVIHGSAKTKGNAPSKRADDNVKNAMFGSGNKVIRDNSWGLTGQRRCRLAL